MVYLYGRGGEGERSECGLLVRAWGRRIEISGLLVRAIAGAHSAFIVHGTETATGKGESVTIDDDVIRGFGINATYTDECLFRHRRIVVHLQQNIQDIYIHWIIRAHPR